MFYLGHLAVRYAFPFAFQLLAKKINNIKADVVSGAIVFIPNVAQTGNQIFHGAKINGKQGLPIYFGNEYGIINTSVFLFSKKSPDLATFVASLKFKTD